MRQSKLFTKTLKETPKEAEAISYKLLARADFISQLASGIYSFLPLGFKVQKKIEGIIRTEMEKIGAQEVILPSLQPKEIWQKTNRWEKMQPPLFKLKDLHKKEFALGSTHEEVITKLAKERIQSYKDFPLSLFQIQTKFRNELRFTGGLLRTKEFLMKDLYSFHQDERDLENYFEKVINAYQRIFKRCNLEAIKSEASGGPFTEPEAKTYEFQIPANAGEDKIIFCQKCQFAKNVEITDLKEGQICPECKKNLLEKIRTIEVGHCFNLGERYSKAFNFYFLDKKGQKKLVKMGCYGIGLGRLMATIVEKNHDEKGIIWPKEVSPFDFHLILIGKNKKIINFAEKIYQNLQKWDKEVLYDERIDKSPGEKFAEADLIGIPYRLVISEKTLKQNSLEIKRRDTQKLRLVKIQNFKKYVK